MNDRFWSISWLTLMVGLLLPGSLCQGQDFSQTLERLKKTYQESEQFRLRMVIRAYEKEGVKTPFFTQQVEVSRQQDNYYYQMADQEMLMNDQYFLMIHKSTREIVFRPRNKQDEARLPKQSWVNLDSLLSGYHTPTFFQEKDQTQHYQFKQKKGEIDQVDLYFSAPKGLIQKIAYRYGNGQVATIEFPLFDLQPKFAPNTFDEKRYIVRSKGKLKGTGLFTQYKVQAASQTEIK